MTNYQSDIRLGDFSIELKLNPESSSFDTSCLITHGYGMRTAPVYERNLSGQAPIVVFNETTPDYSIIQGQLNLQIRTEGDKTIVTIIGELNYGHENEGLNSFQGVISMFEVAGKDIPVPPESSL